RESEEELSVSQSAQYFGGSQYLVEDPVDLESVHMSLGPQNHTVTERHMRQRLDVVGGDIVPPAQPGMRTGGTEHPGGTARGDAQRQRRSLPSGPGEIDDIGDDLRGDVDAC